MSRSKRSAIDKAHATGVARQIIRAFGPAPVLSTESKDRFLDLLVELVIAFKPTDVVMRILVYDIAVFTWETIRLRRYKIVNVEREQMKALCDVAKEYVDGVDAKSAKELIREDSELRQKLIEALNAQHLSGDIIDAQAFHLAADANESLETQLMTLQARRMAVSRELEAYRERVVRKANDEVIDIPADELELAPRLAVPRKDPVS
jgi:hypothetical protein